MVLFKGFLVGVIALWSISCGSVAFAEDKLIFEGESAYTGIQVYDKDDGTRWLEFDTYGQTVMKKDDPLYLYYPYTRSMIVGFAFPDESIKDVLLLGLGGGTLAHFVANNYPEAALDIFEIDPLVVEVAEKYFQFVPGKHGNVSIGDGRQLLRKSPKKYDVIILDAYKAGGIPFHLTTREFMVLVKDHLTPGGVAIIHLWAEYANKYLHAQVKTVADVFPRNYTFYDNAGSHIIFSTEHESWLSKKALLEKARKVEQEKKVSFKLTGLIEKQYTQYTQIPTSGLNGQILTDDFAPVNLLRSQDAN